MSLVSPGKKITCEIGLPEPHAGRARYALEALLTPLGLEPDWSGTPRIFYGPSEGSGEPSGTDSIAASGVVRLAYSRAASEYFGSTRRPYDPSQTSTITWDGEEWPALFTSDGGEADLVASTFLFLSGWHEAAGEARDEHDRVPYEATLPGVLGEAERPVVDAYRGILAAKLSAAGIDVRPRRWGAHSWALCPTHDVDYLRKGRPGIWYRELVHHLLLNRRRASPAERFARFGGFVRQVASEDPYRAAFSRMIREVSDIGGTATYFVKAGAEDPHDVAYSLSTHFLRRRMEQLHMRGFEVGLHPSYRAVGDQEMLCAERDRLQAVSPMGLLSVRQHYLRYDPAATPRLHAQSGFWIDSTIGFSDRPGFRRGTSVPFRLYDLENDIALDLWEMPLTVMESALFNRLGMSVDEAVESTLKLAGTCRRFGGACVVLWHNTLWDELDCPGWGEHFTRTLRKAVQEGGLVSSLGAALGDWR